MTDIGKFRAVDAKDLREFAYGGNSKHLEADLTNLRRQGLIARREIPHQETAPRQLVALTKQGHRLLVSEACHSVSFDAHRTVKATSCSLKFFITFPLLEASL
jgi:DNA-binding HxlR family transcriptional regulator